MTGAQAADGSVVLAFDTATRRAVVAVGSPEGRVLAIDVWAAGHVHGERLLASLMATLERAGSSVRQVGAVVVGTGPGSFTGMRVGIATAKGLAFGLGVPLVGIPTTIALAMALEGDRPVVVTQPAGPNGRYRTVVRHHLAGATVVEGPRLIAGDDGGPAPHGALELALDDAAAPDVALRAGESAFERLPDTLLRLGVRRLATTGPDDLAELGPAYVTLPRGATVPLEALRWSPDRP